MEWDCWAGAGEGEGSDERDNDEEDVDAVVGREPTAVEGRGMFSLATTIPTRILLI